MYTPSASMYLQIFEEIGLSKNEAKIYESLLEIGEGTVSELSKRSKIHRRNIYDSMSRLIEKGLVFKVITRGDNLYRPVDPSKLMELIDERKARLEKVMPELIDTYEQKPHLEAAYIYKGIEGFKNHLRDILTLNEDAYSLGAKGAWFDPKLKTFLDEFLVQAKKKGIGYKHLFDYEVRDLAPHVPESVGPPYKFLPKEYSTPGMIDIYGDRVVTFTGLGVTKISEDITIFVNVSRPLATSYKTWFNFMFDMCPEVE